MHIFLDESGDLGFTKKSSKYFVLTGLIIEEPRRIQKCIKRLRKSLRKKDKRMIELKFHTSSPQLREKVLRKLCEQKISIYSIVVDKETVFKRLRDKKEIYYNYISGLLLWQGLTFPIGKKIRVVMDKRVYGKTREEFDNYIKNKISFMLKRKSDIEILHIDSKKEPALQAVDFISGAIHRKFRDGDETYFNIIKSKSNIQLLHRTINM